MIEVCPGIFDEMGLRVRSDDAERLFALEQYKVVDTGIDPRYEMLVDAMQVHCGVPMAAIAFVDAERMWMKAQRGFGTQSIPRSLCFCSVCMHDNPPMIVEDALLDPRFRQNALVVGEPYLRFYAGYPIFSWDGFGLGSVCVADTTPHTLMMRQEKLLEKVRDWVEANLEMGWQMLRDSRSDVDSTDAISAQRLSFAQRQEEKAWEAVGRLL